MLQKKDVNVVPTAASAVQIAAERDERKKSGASVHTRVLAGGFRHAIASRQPGDVKLDIAVVQVAE